MAPTMPTSSQSPEITRSQRVRAADFDTDWFKVRAHEMGLEIGRYHRKIWEDVVIAQTFIDHVLNPAVDRWQHTSKKPKLRALGFGCGREPIPKWLADNRVNVIATDAPGINPAWDNTNQRAHNLSDLGLDSDNKLVEFREVDMNAIPDDLLRGEFDFTWSSGSFEHIGGIVAGIKFFCVQMLALKPGGIACHTTELNLALTPQKTLNAHDLCLFRVQDIAILAGNLWAQGDALWPPDLVQGSHEADLFVDKPPYEKSPYHLSLQIGSSEFNTTSVVLIATRGERS